MIGEMLVAVRILPRTGDRVDAIANIKGPGETDYSVPVSISGTIQAVWGISDPDVKTALESLVYELFTIIGTSAAPPENGYWFDSYNSESTVQETLNRIRNLGQAPFLKNPIGLDRVSSLFGGGILSEIERIDGVIFQKTKLRLASALDYAFVRSEAEHDLGTPPADNPGLLYRVCILSVIIDGFGIRLPTENTKTKTLKALENWIASRVGTEEARRITESFARIKDLRKQYPIHEHFAADVNGQKIVRSEVESANAFFKFQPHDDVTAKWKKITDSFKTSLVEIEKIIGES